MAGYIEKSLGAGEEVVAIARFHWWYTAKAVLALVFLAWVLIGFYIFFRMMVRKWTTEIGVYVDPQHHRRGVGSLLYAAMFPLIEQRGFRSILAGIELPNPASVRLHEKFGMTQVGTLPNIGFKLGSFRRQRGLSSAIRPSHRSLRRSGRASLWTGASMRAFSTDSRSRPEGEAPCSGSCSPPSLTTWMAFSFYWALSSYFRSRRSG